MDFLSNILFASLILSIIVLIVISYLLTEYEIGVKDYIKIFLYLFFILSTVVYYYKNHIIKKSSYEPIKAAAEVFNEITDSQDLNGIMQLNNILGSSEDELIIDNIPKSIII